METAILDVTAWAVREEEWLGDQEKLWLREPGGGGQSWLFKPSRVTMLPGRGDAPDRQFTWFDAQSELIAVELAELIDVPTAQVRIARRSGESGSISANVVPYDGELQSGDVFLSGLPGLEYVPVVERSRNRTGHHLDGIERVLRGKAGPRDSDGYGACEVFAGFLVLDAWIGNTDRHAENWALIVEGAESRLAPSFDHGSALGSGRDETFLRRTDPREFARGAMAQKFDQGKNVSLVALAQDAELRWGGDWIDRLAEVDEDAVQDIVASALGLSDLRRTFICRMLEENRRRLMSG